MTAPTSSLPEWIEDYRKAIASNSFQLDREHAAEQDKLIDNVFEALATAWDCLENIEAVTTGRDPYSWIHARVVGELKRIRDLGETK